MLQHGLFCCLNTHSERFSDVSGANYTFILTTQSSKRMFYNTISVY
ncbi:unknown [Prevotella sp. CAG:5226]|nr:unknown [Prevotella sp. CAG:5226]